MKVKEFIELLNKQDQEAEVVIRSNNSMEQQNSIVSVTDVLPATGEKSTLRCRDAFDDSYYTIDIWKTTTYHTVNGTNLIYIY